MPDLEGTGYENDALGQLLDELAPPPLGDDDAPPLPAEPETGRGERILLGEHRLLCADARDPRSYARLMGEEEAELLWTDPPYGVEYEGKTKAALPLEGDGASGLEALLAESFAAIDLVLSPGGRLYVAHPAGALSLTFGNCFVAQGWRLRQTLVWVKDAFVLGRSDYHYRHEPILYGHKPGDGRIGRGARGYGDHAQDSVLEVARPRQSCEHPTTKPPSSSSGAWATRPGGARQSSTPSRARARRSWPARPRGGRRASSSSIPATATSSSPAGRASPAGGRSGCGHDVHGADEGRPGLSAPRYGRPRGLPRPAKVGRPSALTPEVHEKIVRLVKVGCSGGGRRPGRGHLGHHLLRPEEGGPRAGLGP